MTKLRFILAATSAALAFSPAAAQRQEGSPEQRIERLEKQIQQMQRQVFPKGRPADTAGFADDPAATQSSVAAIAQRLDSLERQMTDLIRITEESANRQRTLASRPRALARRSRSQAGGARTRLAAAATAQPVLAPTKDPAPAAKPKSSTPLSTSTGGPEAVPTEDPGEAAYTEGFKLWESGRYDDSITALRAFVSAYPKHRRVSFANNLVGRALLDKGEPRGGGSGPDRQLPRQSRGRARARQPLLSRPGADEAWPARQACNALPSLTRSMARKCGPNSRNSR